MKKQKQKINLLSTHQWVVVLCLAAALFALAFSVLMADVWWNNGKKTANDSAVALTGKTVCLPHKPTPDGIYTQECAIGLITDAGKYYALRNQDMSMTDMNQTITVKGELITGPNDKYDIVGTLWVKRP